MIPSIRRLTAVAAVLSFLATAPVLADDLVRLERLEGGDRDTLLVAGVPVVAEMDRSLLAIGDGPAILEAAARHGASARVLAPAPADARFAIASVPFSDHGVGHDECGEAVWAEDDWVLLRLDGRAPEACRSPAGWWIRELRRSPVRPAAPPPAEAFDRKRRDPITPDPAITDMVSGLTDSLAAAHWSAVIGAATRGPIRTTTSPPTRSPTAVPAPRRSSALRCARSSPPPRTWRVRWNPPLPVPPPSPRYPPATTPST